MVRYVALQPIRAGGALAYNPGDPVHPDNVAGLGYVVGEQVAEADSDQALDVLRGLGIIPPAEDDDQDMLPEGSDETGEGPDPGRWTVDELNTYLDGHPGEVAAVLAAEREGKGRAGIIHGRHGSPPDVAEA